MASMSRKLRRERERVCMERGIRPSSRVSVYGRYAKEAIAYAKEVYGMCSGLLKKDARISPNVNSDFLQNS